MRLYSVAQQCSENVGTGRVTVVRWKIQSLEAANVANDVSGRGVADNDVFFERTVA